MKITAKTQKSIFQRRAVSTVEIELNHPHPKETLGPLLEKFFKKSALQVNLNSKLSETTQLENLRGRQNKANEAESLLVLSGQLLDTEKEGEIKAEAKLNTSFLKFEGKRTILHELRPSLSEKLREEVSELRLSQLFRLLPLRWESASVGLEVYKSYMLGSMLGVSPLIVKRFYFDLDLSTARIYIEDSSGQPGAPMAKERILEALEECLELELINEVLKQL